MTLKETSGGSPKNSMQKDEMNKKYEKENDSYEDKILYPCLPEEKSETLEQSDNSTHNRIELS